MSPTVTGMNAVRDALQAALEGDAEIMAIAKGGINFENADEDTEPPYVQFRQVGGTRAQAMQEEAYSNQMWDIIAVGESKKAGNLDVLVRELLKTEDLVIEGRNVLYLRPELDINFREQADGQTYQHVGATYKLITEKEGI